MVSNWCARVHADDFAAHHINRKFTSEPNRAILSQFLGELSSTQSLAIYRVEQVNSSKRDDRDRAMFFLLRMAFWLGLVLVLLPREKTPQSEKLPQIDASQAVQAVTAAVSDMGQFCKRQPQACEVGGQAATVIGVRAQEGARKLYRSVTDKKPENDKKSETDKKAPDHTGSIGGSDDADPALAETAPRDTLTAEDLAVAWRGSTW
jgi:uncharacterized protein DUF5330